MNGRFTIKMDTKQGKIERMYYRSAGPRLTVDSMNVEFECEGKIYTHQLPNDGWGYDVPALQMMGYCGISPRDFNNGFLNIEKDIYISCVIEEDKGFVTNNVLKQGAKQLQQSEWFDPKGTVWNGQGNSAIGGGSADPGTGNRGGVDMEVENES